MMDRRCRCPVPEMEAGVAVAEITEIDGALKVFEFAQRLLKCFQVLFAWESQINIEGCNVVAKIAHHCFGHI